MAMSVYKADHSLADLDGAYIVLHTGDPGADGTNNVAVDGEEDPMTPVAAPTFASAENHPENMERRRLSSQELTVTGSQVKPGQTITHASVWDGPDGPGVDNPLHIAALAQAKLVGDDGARFPSGAIEIAVGVYAKP